MWEHFTLWKTAEFDLMKHDELESIRGPEFGGRPALLDQVLDSFKLSSVSLGQPWNFFLFHYHNCYKHPSSTHSDLRLQDTPEGFQPAVLAEMRSADALSSEITRLS